MIIFQIGGVYFQDIGYMLENLGFRDLILPFILLFTIIFAVLTRVEIFKERKSNAIVALAISLIAIIPHITGAYPPGSDVIEIMNNALPGVALWIVIAVSFLILVGIFNPKLLDVISIKGSGWITGIALVVVIYIFGMSAMWWEPKGILYFLQDSQIQALLIIVAVFAIVILLITGKPAEESVRTERLNWMKDLLFPPPPENPPKQGRG